MNIVTKNAQTQATAPASIGVKTPVRMPPSTMTSVTIPHTASPSILTACRIGTGSPLGCLSR
jgi:hypothetical protein